MFPNTAPPSYSEEIFPSDSVGVYTAQPAVTNQPQSIQAYLPQSTGAYHPIPIGVYSAQQPVVFGQPIVQPIGQRVIGAQSTLEKPPSYLLPSFFVCLCCFWPIGVAAVYYAVDTRIKIGEGRLLAAIQSSKYAKMFTIISFGAGLVVFSTLALLELLRRSLIREHS